MYVFVEVLVFSTFLTYVVSTVSVNKLNKAIVNKKFSYNMTSDFDNPILPGELYPIS